MRKPKPRDGQSRQRPKNDRRSARRLSVRTKHGRPLRRAGLVFGGEAMTVSEAEVGQERFDRIVAEPLLECVEA